MYKLCPEFVHVQWVSNICPMCQFHLSKTQNVNPEFIFLKYKFCPKFVQMKNGTIFYCSGQALDNLWISLSNLCPSVDELDRGLTGLGLFWDGDLTDPLHGLFLDSPWTGIGQGLDKRWIFCPISVQPTKVQ